MYKWVFSLLLLVTVRFSTGQILEPVALSSGRMNLLVDPRLELLCAVQLISDYPAINRESLYSREMVRFFENDTAREVVGLTARLTNNFGFTHDAPIDLILRLSAVPELSPTHLFTSRTIERAGTSENLEAYRLALKSFAVESRFAAFWEKHRTFYRTMLDHTAEGLENTDPVETINRYFNESKNSYTVVISPALAGGYGMRVTGSDGLTDIYACLTPDKIKDGIPYLSNDWLSNFLYHEFSHSFVNPLTDRYPDVVEASRVLFSPIEKEMAGINYGRWITCINEHIVRAVHIRILQTTGHEQEAEGLLELEKQRRFVYIDPIIGKLRQFEQQREALGTTFTQFYPQLLVVFDSLSRTDNLNLTDPVFEGPIQTVLSQQKVVIIYPTGGNDPGSNRLVYDYTLRIRESKGPLASLYADTTALDTDLSSDWIMAYGSVESNLYLKAHAKSFPFKCEGDTLTTNQNFVGKKLRLITCLPNPANRRKGLLVNTSTRNDNLKGVRIPVKADYLVFEEIDSLLQQGFYKHQSDKWSF